MPYRAFGESRAAQNRADGSTKHGEPQLPRVLARDTSALVSLANIQIPRDARPIFWYFTTWHGDAAIARAKTMSWWRHE
jgi:hypothetical protein